ncbi:hypothetical protein DHEL01_v203261 [Diaporthe helianthi]|uniref:Glycosyltransferase family 25 n=1 Tax=Diaporthe helianthi TaxID=158607 RepID=A0A2P5I760_DIAHE|nr:hypothetical protein DHEL01_v203261 [Diaporthe helianthi]
MTALLILLSVRVYQTTETISLPVQLTHGQAVLPVTPEDRAANSTLGVRIPFINKFKRPSWRTRGLQAAAQLIGLDISIPPQPKNPDELVEAFERIGSVVASEFETAFIIEDDVDWDLELP